MSKTITTEVTERYQNGELVEKITRKEIWQDDTLSPEHIFDAAADYCGQDDYLC